MKLRHRHASPSLQRPNRWPLLLLTVWSLGLGLALPQHQAHAEENATPQRQTKKTPALREKVYKVLSEAQAKAEDNHYAEAIAILDKLQKTDTLNSYEAAMMWKFYAFIYYSQDDYDQAIKAYDQLLRQEALPEVLETEALYHSGQLYFVKENYKKAIELLNRWFGLVTNPKPQAYILIGQAHYQQGNMDQALQFIQKAVAIEEQAGRTPKENWYLLLRAIYFEKNNYKEVAKVLEKLVRHYPKKSYWVQLSGIYGEIKQDKKQLSAMEIAYRQGLLDQEKEWLNLAQLFIYQDVPYKAAKVLDEGMKKGIVKEDQDNLKLLSYAWSASQEAKKALPVLQQAADQSKSGDLNIQLGTTYYQLDQWDQAVSAIRSGIKKGDLKKPGNAYLILGLSLFNMDEFDDALYAFKQAAKSEDSKTTANQWINYVQQEIERRTILAKTLEAMGAQ